MFTDPIADYLTRIRNANSAGHKVVDIPASNLKKEMTKILYDQGYILSYIFEENINRTFRRGKQNRIRNYIVEVHVRRGRKQS